MHFADRFPFSLSVESGQQVQVKIKNLSPYTQITIEEGERLIRLYPVQSFRGPIKRVQGRIGEGVVERETSITEPATKIQRSESAVAPAETPGQATAGLAPPKVVAEVINLTASEEELPPTSEEEEEEEDEEDVRPTVGSVEGKENRPANGQSQAME